MLDCAAIYNTNIKGIVPNIIENTSNKFIPSYIHGATIKAIKIVNNDNNNSKIAYVLGKSYKNPIQKPVHHLEAKKKISINLIYLLYLKPIEKK